MAKESVMQWSKFREYANQYDWFGPLVAWELCPFFPDLSIREIVRQKVDFVAFGRNFNLDLAFRYDEECKGDTVRLVQDFLTFTRVGASLDQALLINSSKSQKIEGTIRERMRKTEVESFKDGSFYWQSLLRQTTIYRSLHEHRRQIVSMGFEIQVFHRYFRATVPKFVSPPLNSPEAEAHRAYLSGSPMPPLVPSPLPADAREM